MRKEDVMPKLSTEKKVLLDQEIKEKVYKQAMQMLKENQSQLFTMAELADRVELSKGTLYNYFKDKSEVILFLNEKLTKKVFEDLRQELEQTTDYKHGLRVAFRTFNQTMAEHYFLHVATLIISHEQMSERKRTRLTEAPGRLLAPYMTDFFKRGIAAGVFKDLPVEYLSVFMAATMHGLSVLAGGFGQMAAKDFVAQSKAMEDLLVAAL